MLVQNSFFDIQYFIIRTIDVKSMNIYCQILTKRGRIKIMYICQFAYSFLQLCQSPGSNCSGLSYLSLKSATERAVGFLSNVSSDNFEHHIVLVSGTHNNMDDYLERLRTKYWLHPSNSWRPCNFNQDLHPFSALKRLLSKYV